MMFLPKIPPPVDTRSLHALLRKSYHTRIPRCQRSLQ